MDDITKEYLDVIKTVIDANTKAILGLSSTMTEVRISLKGVQTEVEGHNRLMEEMSESIRELKSVGDSLRVLQSQVNGHMSEGVEARRRINERLDELGLKQVMLEKFQDKVDTKIYSVDSKSKIDVIKLLVNLITWVFGGAGAFTIFAWIYNTFFLNNP